MVEGWSKLGVGLEVGGAGAAGDGDTVLERCKPLWTPEGSKEAGAVMGKGVREIVGIWR